MRHLTSTAPANKPHILAVIDANPKLGTSTKARYKRVIAAYLNAGGTLSDAEALAAYSQGLSKSGPVSSRRKVGLNAVEPNRQQPQRV